MKPSAIPDSVDKSAARGVDLRTLSATSDPSMVITAETPLTDAFLATACPDEGWIVGQDVVEDAP